MWRFTCWPTMYFCIHMGCCWQKEHPEVKQVERGTDSESICLREC